MLCVREEKAHEAFSGATGGLLDAVGVELDNPNTREPGMREVSGAWK